MYHINKEIIGNGENITLENTAKNYFKAFKIFGNSKQEGIPSIDSEAPIESVGDNINLFDKEVYTKDYRLSTSAGNMYATSGYGVSGFIEIKPNKTYSLTTSIASYCAEYNENKVFIRGYEKLSTNRATMSSNAKYFKFDFKLDDIDSIKIEQGSIATPYSPYGQGSVEIVNCNKNVFNGELEDGGYNSTTGNKAAYTNNVRNVNPITVEPNGTYIASNNGVGVAINIFQYARDMTFIKSETISANKYFTTEPTTRYINISRYSTNADKIQIEKGTTITNYIQGKSQTKVLYTQQPFRAIGDVKDRFVKHNGVWYEEHSIYREILDGTENIQFQAVLNNVTRFSLSMQNINHSVPQLCNCLKYQSSYSLDEEHFYVYNNVLYLFINNSIATTVDGLKAKLTELYNAVTPLYVDYIADTPELIECTPEQVEVLEYFDKEASSYDGITNIYSTDEIFPIFDVIAYQRISDEFKTRLKQGKITRGYLKVLATDTEEEFIIDENNYLKDLKIQELRYVPDEGFIGGTVAKKLTGNFNNIDSSFSIQDREVEAYLGVDLADGTTEYIRFGTYIVQSPEDDQVTDNTSFEALDYMIKFNLEYVNRITYPCTMKDLLNDILDQAGVNSKIATFPNGDFIIENNQFETGTTLRDVLKGIAQMAFNWARVDEEDNLVFDFEIKDEVDETLIPDEYFNYVKSNEYGPVNVIILRNSKVEGENITIKDDESINSSITKNICPNKWVLGMYATTGEIVEEFDNCIRLEMLLPIIPSTEYYLNTFNTIYKLLVRTYLKDKSFSRNLTTPTTFTSNPDEYYIGVTLYSETDTSSDLLELINNGTIKPFICLNSETDKTYVSYKALGEIELVISDNPFAYTQEKRTQLIEAGRKLFGLRYTPMSMDMIGLIYLNAKDRIGATNLNGETFYTYLLDHTIDYNGVVLNSMESQAKTRTETKYQFTPQMIQALKHTEIMVDKANQKIALIAEEQSETGKKVAEHTVELEKISEKVSDIEVIANSSVLSVKVYYALSDNEDDAPTSGWSTVAPAWENGKYMWQKTVTTYVDGTVDESKPTNITGATGANGQDGADGIGVKEIVTQYYLSDSNKGQSGGSWKETQDSWEEGKYIWTRSKVTWTDNTTTYTTPILANALNDLNSKVTVVEENLVEQKITSEGILSQVTETTKRLNNDYLTADQVNAQIDGATEDIEILKEKQAQMELTASGLQIDINNLINNGIDKVKTSMGYTFDDEGLKINKSNADTGTIVDEAGFQVIDKTGSQETDLLYAGYVKEENTNYPDYIGQTIVATSNLIVKNYLVIGSNSRFEDYINPTLGGHGTGAFDI